MRGIDLKHDPPKVTVKGEFTKAGDMYITFISKERLVWKRRMTARNGVRYIFTCSGSSL